MSAPREMRCRLMSRALHAHEHDGEHQRDGQGNDDPSPQSKAQEAHHEDDGDRLEERLGEAAERLLHDLRLVRDEVEFDPDGQALHQESGGFVEALAEGEIVAARGHIDADADGGLAIDAEHLGGRIAVAGTDLGDIGQLVEAAVHPKVEVRDALRGQESAGDVDENVLPRRVDDARGHHGILLGDRCQHVIEAELEIRELLRREVEIDLLVLIAEDLDLAHVRRAQELGARGFGEIARLARREAVVGDAVDDAEDVAELIVEEGANHPFRQGGLDVADLFADLIPEVRKVPLGRGFLEIHEDGRLAGLRVALEVIKIGRLFELLFEPVRDLLQGVERGRARPGDLDHHGLHGEIRVLLAAEPLIGADASYGAEQHQEDDDRLVVDRPFGKIEARHHLSSIAVFRGWLWASELTPDLPSISGFTG